MEIHGNNAAITSDNTFTNNKNDGLRLFGTNISLTGFNFNNNGRYGLYMEGINANIINNTFSNNGNTGLLIYSDGAIISGNTANNNNNHGMEIHGNNAIITQNTVNSNKNEGLRIYGTGTTIQLNTATLNGRYGLYMEGINANITNNTFSNNTNTGMRVYSDGGVISNNTVTNNKNTGMEIHGNNVQILQNSIIQNTKYGIYIFSSLAIVNFNRIIGNTMYGLYSTTNGTLNVTNNWWGSNNGPLFSSTTPSDIYITTGTVIYNPWLILNITANPVATYNNSIITADLTHNNAGNDTSSQGNIPDNIPINFVTNLGNITAVVYTSNGKASAIFSRGTLTSGTANITATFDNQTVQTNVIFDETPLAIFALPIGYYYNTTQNVTLFTIDPDSNASTYYTTDGSDPKINGTVYSNPITITNTTTLRYIAFSPTINWGPEYTQNYIIDTTPPTATVNIMGGVYNTTQIVNITATDDADPNPVIYYTLDGSDPTISSTIYSGPMTLQMNLNMRTIFNLKYMVVDLAGNKGQIQNEIYIISLPIVNMNNNNSYSAIQDAINDNSTLNGDVIQIYSGTYVETVTLNKKLTIVPFSGNNVTIQAADPTHIVFTITDSGSGSIIRELILNGSISLQANNCQICSNTIIGNGTSGISASNTFNNTIAYNTMTCNDSNGIQSNSSSNMIYGNTISGCESGIYSENSNNNIFSNLLTNNLYGIWTYNSTDTIQFNRITLNTYGLRNDIGSVNATNNWWGTNNPSNPNDIWIVSGNVNYNPWLVLSVNASSTNSGGNSSVTADLTHNNQGEDTTPQGHVPNGIPVNFTTNYGTIITTSYTVKGRATTILNLGSTQNATVTTTASLDSQNISTTGFISTGTAILTINSTAIDNSTGQPLNITYDIPLNNSVTWLSVVWINTGMFTDELQIIVDGIVVQDKYFNNIAYITWQNNYSTSVFNAIKYANHHLPFINSAELITFWNNLTTTYNLTSTELEFIQNHRQEFIDNLTVNIVYPGVSGFNLTVTDPHSNVINLNFPGNTIQRTSQVIYIGSPSEGVKSFAIATTAVNDDVFQYWWDQYSSYQTGDAMNVAYNTFMTAFMVEYLHDKVANNITSSLNVTWSRTSPIIVSVSEDPHQIYVTLECDHSMGMTVIGTIENMRVFNFVNSNFIPFIEYNVMNSAFNYTFSSVTMELLYMCLNHDTCVDTFKQDGFIILKSIFNDNFVVIDLETGIVRDIDTVNNFNGGIWGFGPFFFKESTKCIRIITIIGHKLFYWQTSNPWDLGTKDFTWDGKGRVFISSSSLYLANVGADNILTITGSNGVSKTIRGVQPALDITDILDINAGVQNISLSLLDTDHGWIMTSPLYVLQKTRERQDLASIPLFPCPIPTWPPIPGNWTLPTYAPFAYPPSEIPIDLNNPYGYPPLEKPITYRDVYDFFKEHTPTREEYTEDYAEIQEKKIETVIYVGGIAAIILLWLATGGAIAS